ncbi:MAG: sulfatase-like hydrolase/transferase [Acidobacteria bacterium]|nr:sulfatase-like hydrolase/transferase [Acidobacteriota bacterium]
MAATSAGMLSEAGFSAPAPKRSGPPNFIIFLLDDHGYHDLGCQGAEDVKTPHIDALAASGARFTNWYSNCPVCAPSRAALLTGRYPIRAGVPGNGKELAPGEKTIAQLLKPQGYTTGIFGKWHEGSKPDTVPNAHGFDRFFGFHAGCVDYFSHRYYWGEPKRVNYHDLWRDRTEVFEDGQYLTELITREAKGFISETRSKPFFAYIPFNAVHYPMHAPRKYVERFPHLEPERQMYAAMLSAADDGVGEIMGTVKKLGLLENTLVFLGADNGATREPRAGLNQQPAKGGSNRPFRGNKASVFDGGMHVAGMMSWPGVIPSGQVIHEVGAHIDLLPTICKVAGAALPTDRTIDGRDILPVAASKAKSPHEALFWALGGQLAVRRGKWKLVKDGYEADGTPDGRKSLEGEDALFLTNLEEDPGESKNRRHDEPALTDELATLAQHWLEVEVRKP